jgi:colanic acid biosynthesis protein WcaH
MLPIDVFSDIVQYTPLISVDLILHDPSGAVLVGLRENRPAQNFWFVPGGRIYKDETIETAFSRIVKTELAPLEFDYPAAKFLGVFQHFYTDNFLGRPGFGTHYIVLAHEIRLGEQVVLTPGDRQHQTYKWMSIAELIADPAVHPNTKYYFMERRSHAGIFPEYISSI